MAAEALRPVGQRVPVGQRRRLVDAARHRPRQAVRRRRTELGQHVRIDGAGNLPRRGGKHRVAIVRRMHRPQRAGEAVIGHDGYQGDACNLKAQFSDYDLIFAANLIDRLYDPAKFLSTIHQRLTIGGVLMIASPYTWLEEHTPRANWIGGFKKDGESFSTLDGLKALLAPHFRLMAEPHAVPFVIRETKRKFQHSLSEVTFWERIQ